MKEVHMKEKWEIYKTTLEESKTMSKKEFLLIITVCVLGGMVLGMLFSPRKHTTIGSNNGNNNGSNNQNNNNNNSGSVTPDFKKELPEMIEKHCKKIDDKKGCCKK